MHPEDWNVEHNLAHHFSLGEKGDPDLLERNTSWLRKRVPTRAMRLIALTGFATVWKPLYYAPTTRRVAAERSGNDVDAQSDRGVLLRSIMPVLLGRFVLLPALALPLGARRARSVFVNLLLAEVIANLQGFVLIAPSHTAADLERFDDAIEDRDEFYIRQILGSCNYKTGGDLTAALHMGLNYQIEHHLWPDLPLRQYQLSQPMVEQICREHGVAYTQGGVWSRFAKMLRVVAGPEKMVRR